MAGAEINLSLDTRKLLGDLGEARKRARDLQPVFDQIGELVVASVFRNFDAEGRPKHWQGLAYSTLMRKVGGYKKSHRRGKLGNFTTRARKVLAGNKILIASGALRNSIHYVATKDDVTIGSPLEYAATHQFGRTSGRGAPIPARPFLIVQEEDDRAIVKLLNDFITGPLQ